MFQKMDIGYYAFLSQATGIHIDSAQCMLDSQKECADEVSANIWSADDTADRNNFRSLHPKTFSTPELFEFYPHHADEVSVFILWSKSFCSVLPC